MGFDKSSLVALSLQSMTSRALQLFCQTRYNQCTAHQLSNATQRAKTTPKCHLEWPDDIWWETLLNVRWFIF